MKIENNALITKEFKDIEIGDVFSFKDTRCGNLFFIKTTTTYDACEEDCEPDEYNSVNLLTGTHNYFYDTNFVTPCPNAILKIS